MTIGKRISNCRKKKGLSQEDIAEKIGVSRQAVSKWENDLTAPDTYNLIELSKIFDVSVEYLALGSGADADKSDQAIKDTTSTTNKETEKPKEKSFFVTISGVFVFCIGLVLAICCCLFVIGGITITIQSLMFIIIPVLIIPTILMIAGWKMMF